MNLRQKTFSAGRWTAASTLASSALQLFQVALLARMLQPADFGLMAVTASILAVLSLFADLGLSRAIVHFETISENALSSLYWLNFAAGVVLTLLFAAAAPIFGDIFRLEGLAQVLLAMSPLFLLSALGQQFRAIAEKELRFEILATNEIISALTGFAIAVIIAVLGGGVYALVGATLASATVSSILSWTRLWKRRWPSLRLHFNEIRPHLRYGRYLIGEGVLSTLVRQADVFVAGLVSNSSALGFYSLPRDLSLRIGMSVNPIITRVGFPVMSRLQSDKPALKSIYMQTLRMTASVNFPIYVALGIYANEIVILLYGQQWMESARYLYVLAAWGLIRSTGNPTGSLIYAVGAVRRAFWWNAAQLVILSALYWISASQLGLIGLAAVMLLVQICIVPCSWHFLVRPYCGITFFEYLQQLLTPLLLALTAGFLAWATTHSLSHEKLRLVLGLVFGGIIYLGLCRIFNRQWFDAMWTLLRLPQRQTS